MHLICQNEPGHPCALGRDWPSELRELPEFPMARWPGWLRPQRSAAQQRTAHANAEDPWPKFGLQQMHTHTPMREDTY